VYRLYQFLPEEECSAQGRPGKVRSDEIQVHGIDGVYSSFLLAVAFVGSIESLFGSPNLCLKRQIPPLL
jgi:hypothetical protein